MQRIVVQVATEDCIPSIQRIISLLYALNLLSQILMNCSALYAVVSSRKRNFIGLQRYLIIPKLYGPQGVRRINHPRAFSIDNHDT